MNAYDLTRRALIERVPALWRALTPRAYSGTGGYAPEHPAVSLGGITAAHLDGIQDGATVGTQLLAAALIKYRMPTYFVGRDLLTALDRTAPPADTRWPDLEWPMPAGVLLLHDGDCLDADGQRYHWIAWARVRPLDEYRLPGQARSFAVPDDLLIFASASADHPTMAGLNLVLNAATVPTLTDPGELPHTADKMTAPESQIMGRLAAVALNAILLMQARPAMVESGDRIEKERSTKKGERISEVWSPNWIGREYRAPTRGDQGGTHASPRMHWRRGHWRMQAHGEGHRERKTLWIEPMLIGGDA